VTRDASSRPVFVFEQWAGFDEGLDAATVPRWLAQAAGARAAAGDAGDRHPQQPKAGYGDRKVVGPSPVSFSAFRGTGINKQWAPKADETIKNAGGTYLVRNTAIEGIEGPVPKLVLISKVGQHRRSDGLAFIRSILADAANSRQGRQSLCGHIWSKA